MPLPIPEKDESKDGFLDRCMLDGKTNEEFPEADQRYAVCQQQWDERKDKMSNEKNFNAIPANACLMSVADVRFGSNGDSAKSSPISLTARSGKPIEHWFWGNVVHDLSGVRMSKSRIAIDYCHDDKEIIGYLNHFDSSSGDLITSGALVPYKENDRASEILFKMKEGVPYQASINFGGDGIKVEEVPEGFSAQVNGYTLNGPACIIREWPLRGVAICPYGADENTDASSFSNSNKTFSATVASVAVPVEKPAIEEVTQMSDTAVEVVATVTVTEATEEVKTEEVKSVEEVKPVEDMPAEVVPTVEAQSVETVEEEVKKPMPVELSREEFSRIADRFGNDIAVRAMREGASFETALYWHVEAIEAKNAELQKQVSELSNSQTTTGKAVRMTAPTNKVTLLALCEKGTKGTK
jgi:hypothetical protein